MSLHLRNRRLGLSYMEMLMASAIFCIIIIPVFPALSQSISHAEQAQEGYAAHLKAQEMLLLIKEAVTNGENIITVAETYAQTWDEPPVYGFWLSDGRGYRSPSAPDVFAEPEGPDGTLIIAVMVWDRGDRPMGRAVGMVNQ